MKSEKSDGTTRSPEIIFTSHDSNNHLTGSNTSIDDNDKNQHFGGFYENHSSCQNIYIKNHENINNYGGSDKDISKNRRLNSGTGNGGRRMSWQTKLDRRRRRNVDILNQSCPDGSGQRRDSNASDIPYKTDENGGEMSFHREKRHSWWNIFVPDQLKNR